MANIKAFKAVRPREDMASKIAALPYDVYNRFEAKEVVKGDNDSFLRIDRPETQFDDSQDMYAPEVYAKGKAMLEEMIADKRYIKDQDNAYYIYQLTMNGRAQNGIVACASIDDYLNGVIKKHENTREEKEQDRIRHVDTLSAQTGPIFLAYRHNETIADVVAKTEKEAPLYDFTSDDDITHRVWKISNEADVLAISKAFNDMSAIYIADGHHRCASAVKVGLKRREENPDYDGSEEFNYFLSVLFPDSELMIMPYNRVVKDLNGLTFDEFIAKVSLHFTVEKSGEEPSPKNKGEFFAYYDNSWYKIKAKSDIINNDPVKGLDVSLLQDYIFDPILGIKDPRTDDRVDFVGGIRGTDELVKRSKSDMCMGFSMYPTSIAELFSVADASLLMPPKSTWFEPKLRSGIFIHEI
ncbi:MAG: DUF1015 family protein [Lachnospiraceae bacterium]|nr:DUF1015 family protein [Lachnospiraceae bacterium]